MNPNSNPLMKGVFLRKSIIEKARFFNGLERKSSGLDAPTIHILI
jgi:hypothetical protein